MRPAARSCPDACQCSRLFTLAEDLRNIVSQECPRCQGVGPDCAVERLRDVASADRPTRMGSSRSSSGPS